MTAAIKITGDVSQVKRSLFALEAVTESGMLASWLEGFMFVHLRERIEARFASEGDDATGKWEPLHPATVEIRENEGFPGAHPINVRTGALYNFVRTSDVSFSATTATLVMPGSNAGDPELTQKLMVSMAGLANPPTVPRPVLALDEKDAVFAIGSLTTFIEAAMHQILAA